MNPDTNGLSQPPANQGYQPPVAPAVPVQPNAQPFGSPQYPASAPAAPQQPVYGQSPAPQTFAASPQQPVQPSQPFAVPAAQPGAASGFPTGSRPESPFAYEGQPYVGDGNPQPTLAAPTAAPTQPAPMYSAQPQPATPTPTSSKKLMWFILVPVIVVMMAVMAGGGWFVLNKFVLSGISATIPSDWKAIDTGLGFTVKAPPKWDKSGASSGELDKIKAKNVTLSPPLEFNFSSSDSGSTPSLDEMVAVTAASFEQTDQPDKAAFEATVTDSKALKEVYSLFGGDSSKIKVEQSKVKIEGREWLKVDIEFEKTSTTTLYHWVDDHAIGLSIADVGDTGKDKSVYQEYLLPMAASVELTE